MTGAIIVETFKNDKATEYSHFVEQLGIEVHFSKDKWVCDKLRRSPSETNANLTLIFSRIPEQHRVMVKYFSALRFVQGKSISTIRTHIEDLSRFFNFWVTVFTTDELHKCDDFIAVRFYEHLEKSSLAEYTKAGTWSSVNMFFKIMDGWDNISLKNPFSLTPYKEKKKFDDKYVPESVALHLDRVFKNEDIPIHFRCTYWILRLIPSRISEVAGMSIDCLKRYNGNYVLFIPTWKQNGGWRDPIMRSIHLEETGIAEYLINLIKKQQDVARQMQEHMPDYRQGALFTYRQWFERKGQVPYYSNQYRVITKDIVQRAFRNICAKNNITDKDGQIYGLTTHQFRHNGITDRLASGFTAAQIAEITGHHGSAMIFNAYAHLNLLPETIIQKQEFVSNESNSRENRYILFGGRILNMEEQLEKRLLRNLRAHKVRGGICSDITGCKSDMWNCLDCKFFIPDMEQLYYYEEQALLWREKCTRFSDFPIIKRNAEKNAELFEHVLKKLREGEYLL